MNSHSRRSSQRRSITLSRVERSLTRCLVCGSSEVRTDHVVDRGVVFLAECPRCEHRWTSREPSAAAPALAHATARRVREVPSAA